ncbi:MAG: ATP-grasp domain-containing protein, partial [Candidatus Omnitrophica bacterium]|nr:ATP-grasp domain-containing protein [Candidatus Omnitrophota bacterium]
MKKIIVLKGGNSPEREVSLRSGAAVEEALKEKGFKVAGLDPKRDSLKLLLKEKPCCVFIALHGGAGEDGTIQAFLETLKIPYTGSPPLASALAMNKLFAKKIFLYHKLPTPEFYSVKEDNTIPSLPFPYPVVVKPANLGSTLGVSIVERKKDLAGAIKMARGFGSPIFIEKYIEGKEVAVSILGNRNPVI